MRHGGRNIGLAGGKMRLADGKWGLRAGKGLAGEKMRLVVGKWGFRAENGAFGARRAYVLSRFFTQN
mgnify:CR=1 FL=1